MLHVARRVAGNLAAGGAEAIVLVGSHARGEAGAGSDLDLLAVGDMSYPPRLEVHDGILVSVSMHPFKAHRESFGQPELLCNAVPGWRGALILHDPGGMAAALVSEAREWTWPPHERRCDEWVAEKISSYAEEVNKLKAALLHGNSPAAAIQRSLLAIHLAPIMAVHRRILCDSENRLWNLVSDTLGEDWHLAQHDALGLTDGTFEDSCAAALKLYELAVEEVGGILDHRQKDVVEHVLRD